MAHCDKKEFVKTFKECGYKKFSTYGLEVLYDYFLRLELDKNIEMEVNPIEVASEWLEDTIADIKARFGCEINELRQKTTVLEAGLNLVVRLGKGA